jgi:hypothetical protein
MIDCGNCGLDLPPTRADGLYCEDDDMMCGGCGTANVIGIDDGDGCAYVSRWTCKHGRDCETPCRECDAEDAKP